MTLRYVFDEPEAVADFVRELVPAVRERGFGACTAMGVMDENGPIAGVVYHNWDPDSGVIQMSGAATTPKWLTRKTITLMHAYPFLELGCQMVIMLVPANDMRLLRQLASGGYTFLAVPRIFGRDRDGVIALLTYEDFISSRFMKGLRNALQQQLQPGLEPPEQRTAQPHRRSPDAGAEPAAGHAHAAGAADADADAGRRRAGRETASVADAGRNGAHDTRHASTKRAGHAGGKRRGKSAGKPAAGRRRKPGVADAAVAAEPVLR